MEFRPKINGPLIAIVGQTASGKTALAIELAQKFNGEIVSADSRTVYRGMDISTAKPTSAEQKIVKHHLIDIANPTTSFSVYDYKRLADAAIADISARGKLPILVGGTGLYVDAVIYDFKFRAPADPKMRKELEALSITELQGRLKKSGLQVPENSQNPRHLIRAIETGGQPSACGYMRPNTLLIGIQQDSEVLKKRISDRVDAMVGAGLVDELKQLADRHGWDAPAMQTPACKAFRSYIEKQITLDEAKRLFAQYDWQYARRQKTWFKRNKDIIWKSKTDTLVDLVTTFLSK